MADYYTQTAFALRVDAAEADILPEIDEVLDAIRTRFESPEDALAFWTSCSERFRQLFPADDPLQPFARFTVLFGDETYPSHGAEVTCSPDPSREGEAILDGQDLDRQHLVAVVKDPACGMLFWNNRHGFGPLKTATVYTQREADAVRLPYAGGIAPGWLELPPLGSLLGDAL